MTCDMCIFFVYSVLFYLSGANGAEYYFNAPFEERHYDKEYASSYDNYEERDYHFDYAVADPHTGDYKSQWEVKHQGVVRGAYSLLEPDGTTRVVEYIADKDGFRAVVKKLGSATSSYVPNEVTQEVPKEGLYENYGGAYSGDKDNYVHTVIHPIDVYEEIHGLTGNTADDSEYTDFEEDKKEQPELPSDLIVSVPYAYAQHFLKDEDKKEEDIIPLSLKPEVGEIPSDIIISVPYAYAHHFLKQPIPYEILIK